MSSLPHSHQSSGVTRICLVKSPMARFPPGRLILKSK